MAEQPRGRELTVICEEIQKRLLADFNRAIDDDVEDVVEIGPDGYAVLDGAYTPTQLHRVAEAVMEARQRCYPTPGLPERATPSPPPLASLHELRGVLGVWDDNSLGGPQLSAAEQGFWQLSMVAGGLTQANEQLRSLIENVKGRLVAVKQVGEQLKRWAAGGVETLTPDSLRTLADTLDQAVATSQ